MVNRIADEARGDVTDGVSDETVSPARVTTSEEAVMKRTLCVSILLLLLCGTAAVAYQVYGEIGRKYEALGGAAGFLGAPQTDETGTPDGVGRYNHFAHGSIYWTPATGAHEVHGLIRQKWADMGWERSSLGYPISDELPVGDNRGRYSNFQGGTIFWSAETGAHEMHSAIMPKWIGLGGGRGWLGYPVSDDVATPNGKGRYVHFEHGSIYWSPQSGAHEVHGAIRDRWAALQWERGALGFPTSDEFPSGAYRRSNFQHGYIRWSAQQGAVASVSLEGDVVLNPVEE
jgi:uncharacterized protein with LGFP repeats